MRENEAEQSTVSGGQIGPTKDVGGPGEGFGKSELWGREEVGKSLGCPCAPSPGSGNPKDRDEMLSLKRRGTDPAEGCVLPPCLGASLYRGKLGDS